MKFNSENKHPIEEIMISAMDKIKTLVDVNTVVGDSIIMPDKSVIIPISKVTLGFVSGGGEYSDKSTNAKKNEDYPFAGGASAGVSISPVGFVLIKDGSHKFLNIEIQNMYEKIIENVPAALNAIFSNLKGDNKNE